ncbi:hypothetical protein D5018_00565 [Parashewanella curva]|uniref:Uncharacterized protein n=1 Tax=Parashewanella curva TaxID=2338552 RepID=A0A3L8Q229_9GAMM|nr:hypothetical protein [Parashewanella curva]RLV61644.1 hypothetical protein D5018_00565 [Parashewanella curva]
MSISTTDIRATDQVVKEQSELIAMETLPSMSNTTDILFISWGGTTHKVSIKVDATVAEAVSEFLKVFETDSQKYELYCRPFQNDRDKERKMESLNDLPMMSVVYNLPKFSKMLPVIRFFLYPRSA